MSEPSPHASGKPPSLPLWRRGGWYLSRDLSPVLSLAGSPRLGMAPQILIQDDLRWQRTRPAESMPEEPERRRLLGQALDLFRDGEVDLGPAGRQSARDLQELLARYNGLPPVLSRRWMEQLPRLLEGLAPSAPASGEPPGLTLVSLPANTFLCLEAVLEAALSGSAVWIRPSRREPFSALRLLASMTAVGWPGEHLALYGTSRDTLPLLVEGVDRAVLYGGEELRRAFGTASNVSVHGPGRARGVVTAPADPDSAARWLLPRVAGDGGRFCKSVGTILVEAPAPGHTGISEEVGQRLAAHLDSLPLEASDDTPYPLPTWPEPEAAEAVAAWIEERLLPGDRWLTRRPLRASSGTAPTVLCPTLVAVSEMEGHPLLGVELPFPFAVIGEVPEDRIPELLGDSLFVFFHPAEKASAPPGGAGGGP